MRGGYQFSAHLPSGPAGGRAGPWGVGEEAKRRGRRPLRFRRRQGTQQEDLRKTGGPREPPLSTGLATPANPFRLNELHEEIDTWLRRSRPCTSSFPSWGNSVTTCCSATYGSIPTSASVTGA